MFTSPIAIKQRLQYTAPLRLCNGSLSFLHRLHFGMAAPVDDEFLRCQQIGADAGNIEFIQ